MAQKVAFLTNVREYTGPPAATAMAEAGWTVFCQDESFAEAEARERFEAEYPGAIAATAIEPARFVEQGLERFGRIDALISNDVPKRLSTDPWSKVADKPSGLDDLLLDFEAYLDSLANDPVRLLRAALPAMREAEAGSIVFITSGAPLRNPVLKERPHGYIAARAAVNTLTQTLAIELARYNIQVNAVAPWLVYSETFFPSPMGPDDPAFAPIVSRLVPMKRFGRPEEMGALIAFLAFGQSPFVSGQVIAFSGAGC